MSEPTPLSETAGLTQTTGVEQPDKVNELADLWFAVAGKSWGLPLDGRQLLEIALTERPRLAAAREKCVYYPDCADVPEEQAVSIRNRSQSRGAPVDSLAPEAEGVLLTTAHASADMPSTSRTTDSTASAPSSG